jgi:GDPmannose 4,6-dehydratase
VKALITGISGQDGKHLTKLLLGKGYEVFGVSRNPEILRNQEVFSGIPDSNLFSADLADFNSIKNVISKVQPNEIYNLASMSYVVESIANPLMSAGINAFGPLRLLQAVVDLGLENFTRIYQASSSEMFGSVSESPQNEKTAYAPVTPYGIAKVFAHYTCENYRRAQGLFVSCGILYNHEGEYRHPNFVSRKISQSVARISLGLQDELTLGNIDALRDWGYAGDYVEAMWLMLQAAEPEDFVIASGNLHSVRDFLIRAFEVAGIENGIAKHVKINKNLVRKFDVDTLVGDASKAERVLGWKPSMKFESIVELMVKNDIAIEKSHIK